MIKDSTGAEVSRTTVPVSTDLIEWAGTDTYGNPLSSGVYSFEMESYRDGNLLSTDTVDAYSLVTETQNQGGELILVLEGGATVGADAISALREPGLS